MRRSLLFAATLATATPIGAQGRSLPPAVRDYVSVDAPVVAITHVKLVDGTGAAARVDQTILISGEKISNVGPSASVTRSPVPSSSARNTAVGNTTTRTR